MSTSDTKLWQKATSVHEEIEKFTVGRDREMDMYLARYDVFGSLAHIRMLESVGLLTKPELKTLSEELVKIHQRIERNEFVIEEGVEDVWYLWPSSESRTDNTGTLIRDAASAPILGSGNIYRDSLEDNPKLFTGGWLNIYVLILVGRMGGSWDGSVHHRCPDGESGAWYSGCWSHCLLEGMKVWNYFHVLLLTMFSISS